MEQSTTRNPAKPSSASDAGGDLMPSGIRTGGVVGVELRSDGAGLLDTQE